MSGKREFGDYQTPEDFAEQVCLYLKDKRGINPSAVVEPTCGLGNFLKSALVFDAGEYYGIEINPDYCKCCEQTIKDSRVKIINSDIFSFSSKEIIKDQSQVLIVGNPPWATNSTLSAMGSENLPEKRNFKGLVGIEAITGASNFDICEYIILRLIEEYKETNAVIAMLCKTSVARNIFEEIKRQNLSFSVFDMLEFNTVKVFGVSASACVLIIQLSDQGESIDTCRVYDWKKPDVIKTQFGYANGQLYSDLMSTADDFDGKSCFEWRQGVKHDCARVMELTKKDGNLINGDKDEVKIETDLVFPLIKSSMFKSPVIHDFKKYVIVTQKKPREDTSHLEQEVPQTWEYLMANKERFDNRRSSIYRGAPDFAMFGVGDYSYARYKVGVSGFYKTPLFSVLYSDDGKPVMTDDTSYFIDFSEYDLAYAAMLLLNSKRVQEFLSSIAFLDAKRPYTKKVLIRLDFKKIIETVTVEELTETEEKLKLDPYITQSIYEQFRSYVMQQ